MSQVICTACSKHKSTDPNLMFPHERYLGVHVTLATKMAKIYGLPCFFLSGRYGLLTTGSRVPPYDEAIEDKRVSALIEQVAATLRSVGANEVHAYLERKRSWRLYTKVLVEAAKKLGIAIVLYDPVDTSRETRYILPRPPY